MTMIEKVARAIARSIDIDPDDGRAEDAMKWIRATAKAAIEAMRRPDINMVEAGYLVHENHYGPGLHPCVVHYRIMIDEALKED